MEELKKINATLTLFMKDDKILLGEKKRGFAKGTLNGIGGKQDPGETIEQAMIRECYEKWVPDLQNTTMWAKLILICGTRVSTPIWQCTFTNATNTAEKLRKPKKLSQTGTTQTKFHLTVCLPTIFYGCHKY